MNGRRRLRAVSLAMTFASLIGLIVCSFLHVHPIDSIVMCIVMIFGVLLYPSKGMFDERRPREVDDAQDYDAKRAEIRERAAEMRSSEYDKKKDDNEDDDVIK